MDLFYEYLDQRSIIDAASLGKERVRILFRYLAKVRENRRLESWRRDLAILEDFVRRNNRERQLWRNSEIFFPAFDLVGVTDPRKARRLLTYLSVLVGMRDLREIDRSTTQGYYRLARTNGAILRADRRSLRDVSEGVLLKIGSLDVDVYLPTRGLFNDMLPQRLYPRDFPRYSRGEVETKINRALTILKGYSPQLSHNLEKNLSSIVLVPPGTYGRSYNLGLRYFGGIFINPFKQNVYEIADSLIHEYTHHMSWLLWSVVPPQGRPTGDTKMASPITGNKVSAFALADALLIYTSHLHFYQWVSRQREGSDGLESWTLQKVENLRRQIPELYGGLKRVIPAGSTLDRFLQFTIERYRDFIRAG